ncbi:uncharacterized protein A4U43_C01F21410 [Asparagus officinalis]|uniref:Uncharacterized protein n=1 Tax=Asparagus officinalis TaxID=4686 RepID=A0A5P1FTK5_ASPOF|nr:uncharacterized protein A4U43_C01F21410 [Asparagus officinalis]
MEHHRTVPSCARSVLALSSAVSRSDPRLHHATPRHPLRLSEPPRRPSSVAGGFDKKGIDENWEAAIEHNPEAFARVVMLYGVST